VSHFYTHIVYIFQQKRRCFSKLGMGFTGIVCVG